MKVFGIVLLIAGILCFAIPSFTFFTTERVADAGFFTIDVQKPHTIVLNPAVGLLMVVAGIIVIALAQRKGVSA